MIDIDELAKIVDAYLQRHADEQQRLAPLLASLDQRTAITDRSTFTGHVTCSALLFNPDRQMLHIRHNALGQWLRPGGHLEPSDHSLYDAALRELEEETQIPAALPRPLLHMLPLDIDVHEIPARPAKHEPDHLHFDLRYVFTVPHNPPVTLQDNEVNDFQWLPIEQINPANLRAKLRLLP
jgi:8-oxo-dGTP pyrophosphatase MutT (NUDIX family)